MKFSTIAAAFAVAAPAIVAAADGQLGFALGDKKPDGTCKEANDWALDFKAITGTGQKIVRTYSANECDTAKNILPEAKKAGYQVVLGIWADYEKSFAEDLDALKKYAPEHKDTVYAITVGSESLYRKSFTGPELMKLIQKTQNALPGFKVGTADSWNKFQDGTADAIITGGVDIIMVNGFSYWQGQADNNASATFFDDIAQAYGHIQELSKDRETPIELWVGETGWPTKGNKYGDALPGVQSAQNYWKKAICGAKTWGINVFFFSAFDEPWKPKSIGEDGTAADESGWGAWTYDRKLKYDLSC